LERLEILLAKGCIPRYSNYKHLCLPTLEALHLGNIYFIIKKLKIAGCGDARL
jgi:hypothetical protein